MRVEGPSREIARKICDGLRAGMGLPVVCRLAGVEPQTLQGWFELGRAASEGRRDGPLARFHDDLLEAIAEAGRRSNEDEKDDSDDEPEWDEPEYRSTPRHFDEPDQPVHNPWTNSSPLALVVVDEAPIEIVNGWGPAWILKNAPHPSVSFGDADPIEGPEEPDPSPHVSDDEPAVPDAEPRPSRRSLPNWAILPIGAAALAASIAAITLIVALVLVVLAICLATTIAIVAVILIALVVCATLATGLFALSLLERWRAGLIALRVGEAQRWLCPVVAALRGMTDHPTAGLPIDRTPGAIALAGRSRPQRE